MKLFNSIPSGGHFRAGRVDERTGLAAQFLISIDFITDSSRIATENSSFCF